MSPSGYSRGYGYTFLVLVPQEPDVPASFGVVDLFAGPGGLGEGFAAFQDQGHTPYEIGISVEKEASAHRTLTLSAFLRSFRSETGHLPEDFLKFHAGKTHEPSWGDVDARAWDYAREEASCLELPKGLSLSLRSRRRHYVLAMSPDPSFLVKIRAVDPAVNPVSSCFYKLLSRPPIGHRH